MAFYRWRTIKGKQYLYYEERYRENGKVRSRSILMRAGSSTAARKDAMERYRDVLRENVMLFGRSNPGERYLREAQARDAYQRFLDSEKLAVPPLETHVSAFEARERMYKSGHPSPAYRVANEFAELRNAARAENKGAGTSKPKGTPTDEEETQHADRVNAARDASDRASAEYDSESPPTTDGANANDGESEG